MKFTINSNELMRVLRVIDFITRDSNSLKGSNASDDAIYALFETSKDKLIIKGASENIFYIKVVAEANIESKGKCILDISSLMRFSFKAKEVTIEDKGETLAVSCGRLKSTISAKTDTQEIEDAIPDKEPEASLSIPIKELSVALDNVIFSSYDTDIEYGLPFSLITTKDKNVYACSNDHFCTTMYEVKKLKGKIKLNKMRTLPSNILERVIKSTLDKNISFKFEKKSFILKTEDITLQYPQPQYDALGHVLQAVEQWEAEKPEMSFKFFPDSLSNAIEEVGSIKDSDDIRVDLLIKANKLILKTKGDLGEAKSYAKIKNVKGKLKSIAVVWNIFYELIAHIGNVVDGPCIISVRKNVVFVESKNKGTQYTCTRITDEYDQD